MHGIVTSGHHLATAAGVRILQRGGNAVDAAAATGFCLAILEPHKNGLGGEVPVLIHQAGERKVYSVSGQGWSPEALTIDWCRRNGIDLIPGDGYLPATVPAMVGTWTAVLARFGTMTLAEVLEPAIELAHGGFPISEALHADLVKNAERYTGLYPSTGEVYLPGDRVPEVGEVFRNPGIAETLRLLVRAEAASGGSRAAGLEAARDAFYEGPVAERILEFITKNPVQDASGSAHTGLLSAGDFAEWRAAVEEPVSFRYRGLDVHKCGPWTQGPVFLQQLALLEGLDLTAMAAADYLHTWVECAKLAFADREAYYGDPLFDDVPLDALLSRDYAAERRGLVGEKASLELRPGDIGRGVPGYVTFDVRADSRRGMGLSPELNHCGDTTHLDTADAAGNMVSATPSGGWISSSPVIRGLGFPLGTRGQMFYLNPARPNALARRKPPRATLTPSLVTRDGEPYLAFGTPGGDGQDQWTLQFFLNYVDLGLDLQAALDTPHFHSAHFPSSFYPRAAEPGLIQTDGRLPAEVVAELERRGHRISSENYPGPRLMAIRYDKARGTVTGAVASTSGAASAFGW
jgi:gamma-glutamyltranspeptidase/glutathione hydrolase